MPSEIKPILVIVATLAAACSGTPRTAEPAAGTVAQAQPAPQALAAANHASAAAGAPAGDVDASLVKEGYSVLRRHDQVLYCRTEVITGNRIGCAGGAYGILANDGGLGLEISHNYIQGCTFDHSLSTDANSAW